MKGRDSDDLHPYATDWCFRRFSQTKPHFSGDALALIRSTLKDTGKVYQFFLLEIPSAAQSMLTKLFVPFGISWTLRASRDAAAEAGW